MEQTINIEELVQDDHNLNKGTKEGQRLMERSFRELGAGRSILVDRDGRIIAGNKSQRAAIAAGIKKVQPLSFAEYWNIIKSNNLWQQKVITEYGRRSRGA